MEELPDRDLLIHLPPRLGASRSAISPLCCSHPRYKIRALDRGPYTADQVVRDLPGKFAFVLYDSTSQSFITAVDVDGSVPFFWGTAPDGCLVLSDDPHELKEGCGKSFAPFPRGCFFSTSGGLQSFEHPLNKLMSMPRVDSKGQMCGANFKVDVFAKRQTSMPRVGSEANSRNFDMNKANWANES